ncbi:MAG: DUF2243 domain-containing protein [Armatimonadaceae bacterium]
MSAAAPVAAANPRPLTAASTLIGIGMGGFVDGILFHQILQIHNMLSARIPKTTLVNAEINMVWDGLFHVFTWMMTAFGIALLWKAGQRRDVPWSTNLFVGGLLQGWGIFNVVEGIIDHHILHVHHVVERFGVSVYDFLFLFSGAVLIGVGQMLIRKGGSDTPQSYPSPESSPPA